MQIPEGQASFLSPSLPVFEVVPIKYWSLIRFMKILCGGEAAGLGVEIDGKQSEGSHEVLHWASVSSMKCRVKHWALIRSRLVWNSLAPPGFGGVQDHVPVGRHNANSRDERSKRTTYLCDENARPGIDLVKQSRRQGYVAGRRNHDGGSHLLRSRESSRMYASRTTSNCSHSIRLHDHIERRSSLFHHHHD